MPQFKPRNTRRAQALRNAATPPERVLWRHLSGGQAGARFARQMPLGPYFADFLCRELKLVIECDGFSHESQVGHDARRDAWMAQAGYRVLRFTNAEVLGNPQGVVLRIAEAVREERERRAGPTFGG